MSTRPHRPRASGDTRVLVLLSETFANGGIQRFNRTFLTACHDLGVECDVLSLNDAEDARSRWEAPASARISVFGHNRLRFTIATAMKLLFGRYDYVVIGHINLLEMVVAVRSRSNGRMLLIAHGIEVWSGLTGLRRLALRFVDSILCVSRYTQQSIQRQAPELPDSRFTIFPNALSESWRGLQVGPLSDVGPLRNLPPRFLLSVTRLDRGDRYKGVVTVLETLAMIEDRSVHYVVAGRGDDLDFIKGVAARLGVTPRVHFIGSVSDAELAVLYRDCLAFVLPSGKEGFGIVFLEAMFFGACVIAASEKGALDVVQDDETGILVPFGDCVALKRAIDRAIADPALRERLAAAGRATVLGNGAFTFQSYTARLAKIYDVPLPAVEAQAETAAAAPVRDEPAY